MRERKKVLVLRPEEHDSGWAFPGSWTDERGKVHSFRAALSQVLPDVESSLQQAFGDPTPKITAQCEMHNLKQISE